MSKPIVAIVGAGSGVSAGVARKFGGQGFAIALVARTRSSLDTQVARLHDHGIEASGFVADVTDAVGLTAAFDAIETELGRPDVLVYNAGANTIGEPSQLDTADLLGDFAVNVAGALNSARLVIPGMVERGSGTILFTGGMLGVNPVSSRASASIGKAGLRNLAFTLSEELSPKGLTVGIVTIGGVVEAGTHFDPDLIANAYWALYSGARTGEIQYTRP